MTADTVEYSMPSFSSAPENSLCMGAASSARRAANEARYRISCAEVRHMPSENSSSVSKSEGFSRQSLSMRVLLS